MKKQRTIKIKPIKFKPIKIHFNLDLDRDNIVDFKDCQPLNHKKQESSFFKPNETTIVKKFMYRGYPIHIVKSEIKFGCLWNPNNKTIICEESYYNKFTPNQQKLILDHEIKEREYALPKYNEYEYHTQAVGEHHEQAWEDVMKGHEKEAIQIRKKSEDEFEKNLTEKQKKKLANFIQERL